MGLDIYLYRYTDYDRTIAAEKAAEAEMEALYERDLSDDERMTERRRIGERYGTDEWGDDKAGKTKIEMPSTLDGEHYFKVGYFRSSYNDSGIERIARNLKAPSLSSIFDGPRDYHVKPDWVACKERADAAIGLWREAAARVGNRKVLRIDGNMFVNPDEMPQSEEDALALFVAEASKPHGFGWFSNRDGHYFLKNDKGDANPLRVLGALPGMSSLLGKRPCTYLVYEEDDAYGWYVRAIEIVAETCAWVLAQPDPTQFVLHWCS